MQTSLYLLGSPRIEREGKVVHVDTRKAIALAAYLVAEGGYQSRDTLCTLLWAENDHASARGALRRTLSVLNSALGQGGLLIEREAIAFSAANVTCDLTELAAALRECETHGHAANILCDRCISPLERAIELYRGEFLQGFTLRDSAEFDLWQFQKTEYVRRLYVSALEKRVRLNERDNRYEAAIELAHRWLALDPLDEPAHRQLIRLYAASGQRTLALRQYHECVRILNHELGVPPLEETTHLYQQIMDDTSPITVTQSPEPVSVIEIPKEQALPLVGRADELFLLEAAYGRADRQEANWTVVGVEGEAGIGKSRLVETFLAKKRAEGRQTFVIRCYESEANIAYAPLIRALRNTLESSTWLDAVADHWLAELVQLLPDITALRSSILPRLPGNTIGRQALLFEAICQAVFALINSEHPGILVFEDLQWTDRATADVLAYLLRYPKDRHNLMLLTWRTEDMPRAHRLRLMLADFGRDGDMTSLLLSRLNSDAVSDLLRASGLPASGWLFNRLFQESEGLPLFLHEYLALLRSGKLGDGEWLLPMGIGDLLRSRLTLLGQATQQILSTAAVIGRSFPLELAHECSGRSEEETVDGVDELLRLGIVTEVSQSQATYEFAHEKMRAVVYSDMSLARRRLLHRRAAQATLNQIRQTDKLAPAAAQIAHHFHLSGHEHEAAAYYDSAGQYARSVSANREALEYFQTALALKHPEVARIYGHVGDLYTLLGDYPSAIRSYEAGVAQADVPLLPVLEQALGRVYHRLGEWSRAEWHYTSVFRTLPAQSSSERVSLLTDWSLTKYHSGQIAAAQELALSALAIAVEVDEPSARAQVHNILGILSRKEGDFERSVEHLSQSVKIAENLGNRSVIVATRNNLALTLAASGQYTQAERLFEGALELCLQQGDRHHAAALHNNLADLFHTTKQPDRAMQHLKAAVSLFVQVGAQDDLQTAEVWKLTEW